MFNFGNELTQSEETAKSVKHVQNDGNAFEKYQKNHSLGPGFIGLDFEPLDFDTPGDFMTFWIACP